eukprot:11055580-Alexandrium_andersonii.AAC.1
MGLAGGSGDSAKARALLSDDLGHQVRPSHSGPGPESLLLAKEAQVLCSGRRGTAASDDRAEGEPNARQGRPGLLDLLH